MSRDRRKDVNETKSILRRGTPECYNSGTPENVRTDDSRTVLTFLEVFSKGVILTYTRT